ncbi:hypothetical protein CQ046_07645 [Chryseobacterium sp. MYb7]|nr:hypothetical protein CQ046_07645 [Chryseobacterium sp. MYb7]
MPNVRQYHSHKKIFLGISKNSLCKASTIFPDTPESCGQKDFKPNPPIGGFRFYVPDTVLGVSKEKVGTSVIRINSITIALT